LFFNIKISYYSIPVSFLYIANNHQYSTFAQCSFAFWHFYLA